jgi:hypothetical protein
MPSERRIQPYNPILGEQKTSVSCEIYRGTRVWLNIHTPHIQALLTKFSEAINSIPLNCLCPSFSMIACTSRSATARGWFPQARTAVRLASSPGSTTTRFDALPHSNDCPSLGLFRHIDAGSEGIAAVVMGIAAVGIAEVLIAAVGNLGGGK